MLNSNLVMKLKNKSKSRGELMQTLCEEMNNKHYSGKEGKHIIFNSFSTLVHILHN